MTRTPPLKGRPRGGGRPARGATVVEFAIVAPVLFLFVFALVEFSRANMVLHTCKIAAAEGARRGIVPGASAADCRRAANAEVALLGIRGATVTVTPSTITPAVVDVTVRVSAPLDGSNGYIFPRFFLGRRATSTVTLSRETADFN